MPHQKAAYEAVMTKLSESERDAIVQGFLAAASPPPTAAAAVVQSPSQSENRRSTTTGSKDRDDWAYYHIIYIYFEKYFLTKKM